MVVPSWVVAESWALGIWCASVLLALLVAVFFQRVVTRLTASTKTELDDLLARHLRMPVAVTIVLIGSWYAITETGIWDPIPWAARGVLMSLAVCLWTLAAGRIAVGFLDWLAAHANKFSVVTPRTLPVFDIAARMVIYGGAIYFLFLAWGVDLTAWIASAGIVGIAVGFAAKDSLANLFGGVFILADAPYKLGDYLVLEGGERGRVTEIGFRATRILTRDDVEVIVPNAVMANVKITNQSTPFESLRVRVGVDVGYGSEIDQVRAVLLAIPAGVPGIVPGPAPRVRFRELGASGLRFELLFWVAHPELRGSICDEINTRIYNRFRAEGIEIPYAKHDVYLHTVAPSARIRAARVAG